MIWYVRLFGFLRENALCAHDVMYPGRYEKSLCSDNDPPCYSREMKIIYSDWVALIRRLLMNVMYESHHQSRYFSDKMYLKRIWGCGRLKQAKQNKNKQKTRKQKGRGYLVTKCNTFDIFCRYFTGWKLCETFYSFYFIIFFLKLYILIKNNNNNNNLGS